MLKILSLLGSVALALAACAPAESRRVPLPPSALGSASAPARSRGAEPPKPRAELECRLAERPTPSGAFTAEILGLESLSNVGRLAIGVDQPSFGARRVAAPRAATRFPKVRFERIEAHAYRYWYPLPPAVAAVFPGCDDEILSDDGRVCPHATLPGVPLSPAQSSEILAVAALPDTKTRMRCEFDPHHAFVFRDARGRPVAEIRVCFGCGEWMLDDEGPRALPEGAFVRLAALCRELGLGGCPLPKLDDEDAFRRAYREWTESGAPLRASAALGIPESTLLSALTPEQRQKLCAYRAAESPRPYYQHDAEAVSERPRYELESGRAFWLMSYDECIANFPKCDVPLASVEEVRFHRTRAPGRPLAQSLECLERAIFGPNGECVWGVGRAGVYEEMEGRTGPDRASAVPAVASQ